MDDLDFNIRCDITGCDRMAVSWFGFPCDHSRFLCTPHAKQARQMHAFGALNCLDCGRYVSVIDRQAVNLRAA